MDSKKSQSSLKFYLSELLLPKASLLGPSYPLLFPESHTDSLSFPLNLKKDFITKEGLCEIILFT
jgi:hypothetical protein